MHYWVKNIGYGVNHPTSIYYAWKEWFTCIKCGKARYESRRWIPLNNISDYPIQSKSMEDK